MNKSFQQYREETVSEESDEEEYIINKVKKDKQHNFYDSDDSEDSKTDCDEILPNDVESAALRENSISPVSSPRIEDIEILVRESLPIPEERENNSNVGIEILESDNEDSDVIAVSPDSVIDITSNDDDIVEPSPPRRIVPVKPFKRMVQPKIDPYLSPRIKIKEETKSFQPARSVLMIKQEKDNTCNISELKNQQEKVNELLIDFRRTKNVLQTMNVSKLPDGGAALYRRVEMLQKSIKDEEKLLESMKNNMPSTSCQPSWETIKETANHVQPAGFGKRALETFNTQKTVTMDKLKELHGSIAGCPAADVRETDPAGLNVTLMPHQQHALAWLLWREKQTPPGGMLADDMGLGKTLTMIALIIKKREIVNDELNSSSDENSSGSKEKSKYYPGGTLVVCPASLINQWKSEVKSKCKKHLLTVNLYHGSNREPKAKRLAKYDIVITTYNIGMTEFSKKGTLFKIKWDRIILDESHVIRNRKSQTAEAMFALRGRYRWALTGTPIHNKELDMYSVLKFLRCSPFDDLQIWKKWVGNTSGGGQERLHTVVKSIMLRRTKDQLQAEGVLMSLPEKSSEDVEIALSREEMQVYQKILLFSKTLFAQFLHQRAEKNTEFKYQSDFMQNSEKNEEYVKMHKKLMQFHGATEVKSHEILVLLLRLRQICNHPCLIKDMIRRDNYETDGIDDEDGNDIDLLEQLSKLNIDEEEEEEQEKDDAVPSASEENGLNTAASKILNPDNAVFNENQPSSKIKKILDILNNHVLNNSTDKGIVVSQWTGMLKILEKHLNINGIQCLTLNGDIPVQKRMPIIDDFNNPNSRFRVLLLSLTAGGVGLNLVGANHLLLIDPHWNPQLEAQAQDRIYRMGQKKAVKVYKFISIDTIEQRIKHLQEQKLEIAASVLTGQKMTGSSKLTIEDMCMLFNM